MSPGTLITWREALGGRRFLLTVGAGVVNTALVWFGKISPEIFRDLILGTVAVYIAGATVHKVKGNGPNQSNDPNGGGSGSVGGSDRV